MTGTSLTTKVADRINNLREEALREDREKPFIEYASGKLLFTADEAARYFQTKRGLHAHLVHNLNKILQYPEVHEPRLRAAIAVDSNDQAYIILVLPKS